MYTDGIKSQLSQEEVKEAIELGAKTKDPNQVVSHFYSFGHLEGYHERGIIITKFSALLTRSWQAARKYQTIDNTDIDQILRTSSMTVLLYTYQARPDLVKDSHIVLKQGDKIIQPLNIEVSGGQQISDPDLQVPVWEIEVAAFFGYSDIDPKARTTIILITRWGESKFEVDFSRYK